LEAGRSIGIGQRRHANIVLAFTARYSKAALPKAKHRASPVLSDSCVAVLAFELVPELRGHVLGEVQGSVGSGVRGFFDAADFASA
jgi:hypothetical protein